VLVLVVIDPLHANKCSCLVSSKQGLNVVVRAQGEELELETMLNVVSAVATSLNVYMFSSTLYMFPKSIYKEIKKEWKICIK